MTEQSVWVTLLLLIESIKFEIILFRIRRGQSAIILFTFFSTHDTTMSAEQSPHPSSPSPSPGPERAWIGTPSPALRPMAQFQQPQLQPLQGVLVMGLPTVDALAKSLSLTTEQQKRLHNLNRVSSQPRYRSSKLTAMQAWISAAFSLVCCRDGRAIIPASMPVRDVQQKT